MQILTLMNAHERTAQDFENLFTAADPRFKLADIHRSPGSPLALMEADFSEVNRVSGVGTVESRE